MKRIGIVILFLLFLTPNAVSAETLYDQYKTDLGLTINSYSENWTGYKLIEVYEEFKKNTYGDEIKYLKEINLYSDNPSGGQEEGVYNASYNRLKILGNEKIILSKENTIDLYNLSNKQTVEDFARTLSHEYGHHFTLYYLIQYENKTFDDWRDTKLYQVRKLEGYDKVTNNYINGHEWSIIEICAEDYVQLYGSSTGKEAYYFEDIEQRYYSGSINKSASYQYSIYNINPQENNNIPLVLEVPQVKEYWQNASGMESKVKAPTKPTIALVDTEDLGYDKIQYKLQWTKSIDIDEQEVQYYTVVATDLQGEDIIPIKTVSQGEPLEAVVGSIRVTNDKNIMFYTDSFIDNPKLFKVYAMSSIGGIVSSDTLKVDFNNPSVTTLKSLAVSNMPIEDEKELAPIIVNRKGNKYIDKVLDMILLIVEKIKNFSN
ncbi:hypothetical protein GC105_13995 [Alkalibaculum sp. M08DMB]|uniref:Uncharacterized protein n=1 Tax=Alkalibaculum sporogenes TaxID=2655001 RepID=A0A6A7KD19_9FIRM|nr:hypothetical protein [Alkalibaculum sporogenes]MPW26893.1 hypothetical protein [Alkalibaculum sporogenes]